MAPFNKITHKLLKKTPITFFLFFLFVCNSRISSSIIQIMTSWASCGFFIVMASWVLIMAHFGKFWFSKKFWNFLKLNRIKSICSYNDVENIIFIYIDKNKNYQIIEKQKFNQQLTFHIIDFLKKFKMKPWTTNVINKYFYSLFLVILWKDFAANDFKIISS